MLTWFKWIAIAVVSSVAFAVAIIALLFGIMYFKFAQADEHLMKFKVPKTDAVLNVYSKRSHPMLPEFHRRMVVTQPGLPEQDVEIWPDPVGHNILEVHAVTATSGVLLSVSDPKLTSSSPHSTQGIWFDQVLPFNNTASTTTFETQTFLGHFDTREMKWVPAP